MVQNFIKSISYFQCSRSFHTYCKLFKEVKNLKGKHSSQLWMQRQINDPYVEKARKENYRCRSAFKLLEINEGRNILQPGQIIVECGAAPGSWTQVATKLTNANGKMPDKPKGKVIAIDKLPIIPIEGAEILMNLDFTSAVAQEKLRSILKDDKVDILLSDMAPNATGMKDIDHECITFLVYSALKFSLGIMKTGGSFLAKLWDGGKRPQLEVDLLKFYKNVKIIRPKATRSDSTEIFFLARHFKGVKLKNSSDV